jgi:uncharacterized UBP type Zn finger protein
MVRKCIYCGRELDNNSVIDFCEICGVQVWGKKMFDAIVSNMEEARLRGDLVHNNSEEKIENKEEIENEELIKNEELNDFYHY